MLDLTEVFQSLALPHPSPASGLRFSALPIPSHEQHRLGKDGKGAPALLLSVADAPPERWLAPIALEHLSVQHDLLCHITHPSGTEEEGRFAVVYCTSDDSVLRAYFLRVAGIILTSLRAIPSHAEVTREIDKLVELFRAMTLAPRKSVQGLWAELFVIAQADDPALLTRAWHTQPEDRYDFSAGSQRIEVKSVSGRARQHYFTVEQLHPLDGTDLLIASMFIERAGSGLALMDLITQVRAAIGGDPHLLLRVDQVIGLTLGSSWRSAQEERFDRELAAGSLAFYRPEDIPKVSAELPEGVSNVRFRSDLTGVSEANTSRCRAAGGLFKAVMRR